MGGAWSATDQWKEQRSHTLAMHLANQLAMTVAAECPDDDGQAEIIIRDISAHLGRFIADSRVLQHHGLNNGPDVIR